MYLEGHSYNKQKQKLRTFLQQYNTKSAVMILPITLQRHMSPYRVSDVIYDMAESPTPRESWLSRRYTKYVVIMLLIWSHRLSDEYLHLLKLYWIPSLHKNPYKQRYIARSTKYSTKPLS